MENQQKYIDSIFHYSGKWEMPSLCGLMIKRINDLNLVVLTELYQENPGSSVTEMIEPLATEIVKNHSLDPGKTEFIVRNPERSSRYAFYAETFYRAELAWDGEKYSGINWKKLNDFEL